MFELFIFKICADIFIAVLTAEIIYSHTRNGMVNIDCELLRNSHGLFNGTARVFT
jgi:hypothetical protein